MQIGEPVSVDLGGGQFEPGGAPHQRRGQAQQQSRCEVVQHHQGQQQGDDANQGAAHADIPRRACAPRVIGNINREARAAS